MKSRSTLLFLLILLITPKASLLAINLKAFENDKNKTYQIAYQYYTTQSTLRKEGNSVSQLKKEIFDEKTWQITSSSNAEYKVELIKNEFYWRNKEGDNKWKTIDDNYSYLPCEKNVLLHKEIRVKVRKDSLIISVNDESISTSKACIDNINQLRKMLNVYLLHQKAIAQDKFTIKTRNNNGNIEYTPLDNYNTTYSPLSYFKLENKTGLGTDYKAFYEKDESYNQKEYCTNLKDSTEVTYAIHSITKENLTTIITNNVPYIVTYRDENNEQRDSVFIKTNAVLKGHIANFIADKPITLDFIEKLPGLYKKKAFVLIPDKDGNFEFKIYLEKPMEFAFWHKEITPFILAPGDNLNMTLDMKAFDETVSWEGKGYEKNRFLSERFLFEETLNLGNRSLFQQIREQYSNLNPEQFKSFCDSISQIKYGFLQQYVHKLNPSDYLGFYYEEYLNNYTEKTGYDRKQQYYRMQENKTPYIINDDYYDFKDSFHADNDLMSFAQNYETSITGIVFFDIMYDIQNKYSITFESLAQHYENRLMFSKLFYSGITEYTLAYITLGDVIEHADWEQAKRMMTDFYKDYPQTPYCDALIKVYAKAQTVSPGQPAYDFELEDLNGNLVKLSDYKGKAVYIDFWATTSGPSRQQIENYSMKLEDRMKGKDIVFMYVACEGDVDRVKSYLTQNNIEGVLLITKDKDAIIRDKYWFSGIPQYYIIDKEGNINQRDADRPGQLLINPDVLIKASL